MPLTDKIGQQKTRMNSWFNNFCRQGAGAEAVGSSRSSAPTPVPVLPLHAARSIGADQLSAGHVVIVPVSTVVGDPVDRAGREAVCRRVIVRELAVVGAALHDEVAALGLDLPHVVTVPAGLSAEGGAEHDVGVACPGVGRVELAEPVDDRADDREHQEAVKPGPVVPVADSHVADDERRGQHQEGQRSVHDDEVPAQGDEDHRCDEQQQASSLLRQDRCPVCTARLGRGVVAGHVPTLLR